MKEYLIEAIKIAQETLVKLRKADGQLVDSILIHYLQESTQIAQEIVQLPDHDSHYSYACLLRCLFEHLIIVCWLVSSPENSKEIVDSFQNEMKRIMRNNLQAGAGQIVNEKTGELVTDSFLKSDSMSSIRSRKSLSSRAQEVGLEQLYIRLYGALSILPHGNTYGMAHFGITASSFIQNDFKSISSILKAINNIASNWHHRRTKTTIGELYEILGIT